MDPYLYIIDEHDVQVGNYIALSYCWGTAEASRTLITEESTLQDRKRGIRMADLPRTISDAVKITRKLSVRFLWVDALCIIQGSSIAARYDWEIESSKMAEIYGNALLTLIAGSSSHCDGGILGPRSGGGSSRTCQIPYSVDPNRGSVFIELQSGGYLEQAPVNLRAWTLQERVLSSRTLTYYTNHMRWRCLSGSFDEKGKFEERNSTARDGDDLSITEWHDLVADYAKRRMTNPMDKLTAISGLARKYHTLTGDLYLAGLWRQDLPASLMWRTIPHGDYTRPTAYRAPSWSWATIDGVVISESHILTGGVNDSSAPKLEIVSWKIDLAGPDPFGRVSSAQLHVLGHVKQISGMCLDTDFMDRPCLAPYNKNRSMDDYSLAKFYEEGLKLYPDGETCDNFYYILPAPYLLFVGSHKHGYDLGLILESIQDAPDTFRRVGFFESEHSIVRTDMCKWP